MLFCCGEAGFRVLQATLRLRTPLEHPTVRGSPGEGASPDPWQAPPLRLPILNPERIRPVPHVPCGTRQGRQPAVCLPSCEPKAATAKVRARVYLWLTRGHIHIHISCRYCILYICKYLYIYMYVFLHICKYIILCICVCMWGVCMCVCARTPYNIIYIYTHVHIVYIINMPSDSLQRNLYNIPVLPHKAVAEVSKIGNL